jgi:ornithine cyclodeaminase/alanine dehydrogenase-like protein (mu-crystallin family)
MTEEQIQRALDPAQVIEAIELAFRDRFPQASIPVRTPIETEHGTFLSMPCYDRLGRALGMKLVVVQHAPKRPEDRVQATYLLLNPETGEPQAVLPARYLTDLRTAATSAVATRYLSRADASTLGIFGTGRQARIHLKVIPLVRTFKRILVCGKHPASTLAFTKMASDELQLDVAPATGTECAACDVICTCTTSVTPVFDGNLLRPGTHLNAVGAFQPSAREVDTVAVSRAKVVVDTYAGVLAEAGDLLIPMQENAFSRDQIYSDLHELVSGKNTVRTGDADITLFKSVGCALEDLVTAELALQCGTDSSVSPGL